MLFAKAKNSQVRLITKTLNSFCAALVLMINFDKSRGMCCPFVSACRKENFTSISVINFFGDDALFTNLAHFQRHMSSKAGCVMCGGVEESMLHVIHDCPVVMSVWKSNRISLNNKGFFYIPLQVWLESNLL